MNEIKIKQATKQGYIECDWGGCADLSYPGSKYRRGRVQGNGHIHPTITRCPSGVVYFEKPGRIRILTSKEEWRLMGFSDEDYEKAAEVNNEHVLHQQAGNSITKNVLEAIFNQMI